MSTARLDLASSAPSSATASLRGGARRSNWTPEHEARATRLFLREGLTAAEVAEVLGDGFTRASVAGKMRRIGCLKRQTAPIRDGGPRVVAKPSRPRVEQRLPPIRPPQPLPPLREIGATGIPATLADLPRDACRWPIDDPGPGRMHQTLFCAGPSIDGRYCAAHHQLAHDREPPAASEIPQVPFARAA